MKKTGLLVFLISLSLANLHADDQTASVQQELKDQGFYYGQVDGQPGAETTAAVRRYQIRNGLQVTGTLTQETVDSLRGAAVARAASSPAKPANNQSSLPPPPAPLDTTQQPPAKQTSPPQQDVAQSDREFLRKQDNAGVTAQPAPTPPPASRPGPNVVPPPVTVEPPAPEAPPLSVQFASLFARTPYQNAPLEVQQGTLRSAQVALARDTYYNGEIDGIPGPATAHAILAFQANTGLAQTGRLDLQTLGTLRLLPHQSPGSVRRVIIQPFYPPPIYVQPRVYRGGWVD